MAEAFIDLRELDAATLRDIAIKSGAIWPDDDDRESRLFRFHVRRIATEAYRRGIEDGQKITAAVTAMNRIRKMPDTDHKRLLDDVQITPGFAIPPYRVETYPIGSCVVNSQGFNVLSFKNKPGAKFTSLDHANQLCAGWNKAAAIGEQMP